MADPMSEEIPDLVEMEISLVGRFFRPPLKEVGFLPLDAQLDRTGWRDRLLQSRLAPWQKEGVTFGVPHDVHPCTITYRDDLFREAGVDLVLGGHIHLQYLVAVHERDASLPRPLWVGQAGTAVSSRVRHEAGNSVNILRTLKTGHGRCCCVERWDFAEGGEAFEPVNTQELAAGLTLPQVGDQVPKFVRVPTRPG